jgi:group I intron endonuclease
MIIYRTTNLLDGKIYIGKDKNNIPSYLGSGIRLLNAINKYGKENFKKDVLEICSDESTLNEREVYWIEYYRSYDKSIGYNLTKGGEGGNTRVFYNKKKMSKYKTSLSEGVKNSSAYKDSVERKKGKPRPGHSKKMKELYASGKIIPHNLGKPNSPETRAKISAKNRGKVIPSEVRKKMGISKMKPIDMFSKDGKFLQTFKSIQEASEVMKVGRDSVYGCCIGKYKQGGGYIWKYSCEIK